MMKKYIAEFIGTFSLVFCATGAVIINQLSAGAVSHQGIAITSGLIVMAMIYAYGEVSGAHINPAVSIGFSIAGLFPAKNLFPYILSQLCGAFVATLLLKSLFPGSNTLGETLPSGSVLQSVILECILSFLLMTVILNVSQGAKEKGIMAGIAIGGTVMLEVMFAGPVSGASMNPARSISPAVVNINLNHLWIYICGPVSGSLIAALVWTGISGKKH